MFGYVQAPLTFTIKLSPIVPRNPDTMNHMNSFLIGNILCFMTKQATNTAANIIGFSENMEVVATAMEIKMAMRRKFFFIEDILLYYSTYYSGVATINV